MLHFLVRFTPVFLLIFVMGTSTVRADSFWFEVEPAPSGVPYAFNLPLTDLSAQLVSSMSMFSQTHR